MFLICHFACTRLKLQVFSLVIQGVLDTFAIAKLSKLTKKDHHAMHSCFYKNITNFYTADKYMFNYL